MQTAQELKDYFRTTLVAPRTVAQEFLALDALVDFANQNDNTNIPDWTGSLTFQLDGSDDGAFCTEPDTNGRIRFFKTKVNNNTNNTPPTDPLITENAYWIEVSPGDGSAVKEWAAGVYGEGLIIVYFDTSGTGADPDLYVLAEATRPFHSTNFTTELAAGKWKRMQTVFDVAATGGTDVMNIGTNNADVINIGRVGATVNIYGNTIYSQVTNLEVSDKLIRLNRGGAAASAGGSGFELEENAVITGYIKTTSDRNGYELKAPNQAGIVTLEFNASGDLIIKPAGTTKLTVSSTGAAVAGNVSNTGALFFSGAVSPAQITGNQNDYNPTDFHNFANVRLSSDASRDITGFGAPVAGEFKVVHNVGSFDIVFKNSDAGSAAANRFALNADFTLKADQSTIFWYDPTSSRWRAIQAGSGGAAGAWLLASGGTLTGNNTITMGSNTILFTGNRVSFTPNATVAGLNIGSVSANPSTTTAGDLWYRTSDGTYWGRHSGGADVIAFAGTVATNQIPYSTGSGTGKFAGSTALTFIAGVLTVTNEDITQPAASSGWRPAIKVTPGSHTSMTATSEFISNDFLGATWTWLSGTVARQRFTVFKAFTVATATVTHGYGVYIESPLGTVTNSWALGVDGNIQLGNSNVSGTARLIEAASSSTNCDLTFKNQGSGTFNFNTTSGNATLVPAGSATAFNLRGVGTTPSIILAGSSSNSGLNITSITPSSGDIEMIPSAVGTYFISIKGSAPASSAGGNVSLLGGSPSGGNNNGGDATIGSGIPSGSGAEGNVNIQNRANGKLGFFNVTPVVRQAGLTAITHTAPGTPDYSIQDLTNAGGFGFATKDEGNTVLSVIKAMHDAMKAYGLLT